MKTQLVRNTLTLNDLDRLKTKMDDDLKESISKIVIEFENHTQVVVQSIQIVSSWDDTDKPTSFKVFTLIDLFNK